MAISSKRIIDSRSDAKVMAWGLAGALLVILVMLPTLLLLQDHSSRVIE